MLLCLRGRFFCERRSSGSTGRLLGSPNVVRGFLECGEPFRPAESTSEAVREEDLPRSLCESLGRVPTLRRFPFALTYGRRAETVGEDEEVTQGNHPGNQSSHAFPFLKNHL